MSRAPFPAASIATQIADATAQSGGQQPVDSCVDIDMRIIRDGTWLYHGSPIGRKRLVKLFSTVLRQEDDGNYYLVTPVERCMVFVDDAPFVAVEVTRSTVNTRQVLTFRTNLDDEVVADQAHPIRVDHDDRTQEPSPYVLVRDRLDALITRSVYYELVGMGVEETRDNKSVFGVWSAGKFFELGSLEDA